MHLHRYKVILLYIFEIQQSLHCLYKVKGSYAHMVKQSDARTNIYNNGAFLIKGESETFLRTYNDFTVSSYFSYVCLSLSRT